MAKTKIRVVWTTRPAELIRKGPECSEIRWLDTKSIQAIPNDQVSYETEENRKA